MVDFEMPLKNGGYIEYDEKYNIILTSDRFDSLVEIYVDDLIKLTNTNFWKYLSKQVSKED